MNKEILIVWQNENEMTTGSVVETDELIIVCLDDKSKSKKLLNEIELMRYKNDVLEKIISKLSEDINKSNTHCEGKKFNLKDFLKFK